MRAIQTARDGLPFQDVRDPAEEQNRQLAAAVDGDHEALKIGTDLMYALRMEHRKSGRETGAVDFDPMLPEALPLPPIL